MVWVAYYWQQVTFSYISFMHSLTSFFLRYFKPYMSFMKKRSYTWIFGFETFQFCVGARSTQVDLALHKQHQLYVHLMILKNSQNSILSTVLQFVDNRHGPLVNVDK